LAAFSAVVGVAGRNAGRKKEASKNAPNPTSGHSERYQIEPTIATIRSSCESKLVASENHTPG